MDLGGPGSCLRGFVTAALMRADLWPIVQAGKLSLPIYATYALDDIAEALTLMRSNQHLGKIVISIG